MINPTTLSSYLLFNLITSKKVYYHPAARNSPETKAKIIPFCEFFIQNEDKFLIYIDEVGYI